MAHFEGCIVLRSMTHGDTFATRVPSHLQGSAAGLLTAAREFTDRLALDDGETIRVYACPERDPGAARLSGRLTFLDAFQVLHDECDSAEDV